jgi:hypothetical protein
MMVLVQRAEAAGTFPRKRPALTSGGSVGSDPPGCERALDHC